MAFRLRPNMKNAFRSASSIHYKKVLVLVLNSRLGLGLGLEIKVLVLRKVLVTSLEPIMQVETMWLQTCVGGDGLYETTQIRQSVVSDLARPPSVDDYALTGQLTVTLNH